MATEHLPTSATDARHGASDSNLPDACDPQAPSGTRATGGTRPVSPVAIAGLGLVAVAALVLVTTDGSTAGRLARTAAVAVATAVIWLLLHRLPTRIAAVALVLLAVLAVPAGLGIGLPHLAKTGLEAVGLAGVAALAGGLLLFAAGVRRLGAGWRLHWSLSAALVSVAGLGVSSWTLGQAVAATHVPRTAACITVPAELSSKHEVTFLAADGVRLSGWYVPGRNGAAVVLRHGAGSTRCSVRDQAVVLARHGYAVLLTDARGHGSSGGRAMDFGWYGERDIAAAVAFLRHQHGVDPDRIGAVGLSMGGEEAIGALGAGAGLTAVVAEGATGRVAADQAWLPGSYGWRGSLTQAVERITYAAAGLFTDAPAPATLRASLRDAAPAPVLLITAGTRPDEANVARYLHSASPATVRTWNVPLAAHTAGLRTQPQQWEDHVTSFLDGALLG